MKKVYVLAASLLTGVACIFYACKKEESQNADNVINFDVKLSADWIENPTCPIVSYYSQYINA